MDHEQTVRIPGALILALIALGIAVYAAIVANEARDSAKDNERYVDRQVSELRTKINSMWADTMAGVHR